MLCKEESERERDHAMREPIITHRMTDKKLQKKKDMNMRGNFKKNRFIPTKRRRKNHHNRHNYEYVMSMMIK
jgi:hypothetical protein